MRHAILTLSPSLSLSLIAVRAPLHPPALLVLSVSTARCSRIIINIIRFVVVTATAGPAAAIVVAVVIIIINYCSCSMRRSVTDLSLSPLLSLELTRIDRQASDYIAHCMSRCSSLSVFLSIPLSLSVIISRANADRSTHVST